MTRRLIIYIVLLTIICLVSCKDRGPRDTVKRTSVGCEELLIGLSPEQNIFRQRERYQHLGDYLSKRLGISVTFTSLSRYGNIVDRFVSERMDGAFFGSFTYALARQRLSIEPLARPVNMDGTSTYHGYIFVRKDSGIRTAADMRGRRFAFVDYATTAGYVFPIAYFRENGIHDLKGFLAESIFTGSHDAAVFAVLNREADAGAAKNTIYDALAAENPRIERELMILATSQVVPQNCLAVRGDLDPELKKALKTALLEMDRDPEGARVLAQFRARGFIETLDREYEYVYTMSRQAGIDLKKYEYSNR